MGDSKRWIQRHVSDPYVKLSRSEGYRSRAAYKLLELLDRDRLLGASRIAVDLGAAPGSWSQVLAQKVGPKGRVVALDLLPMDPVPGVTFIQGDFREDCVLQQVEKSLEGTKPGLVVSDMAPNLSGIASADQARSIHLCELAMEFARNNLIDNGNFLVKAFQGGGFPEFLREAREVFRTVLTRKPDASRNSSSEIYVLGKGLRK